MFRDLTNLQFLKYVVYFLLIPIGYLHPVLNWVVILSGPILLYKVPNVKLAKNQKNYLFGLLLFLIIILATGVFSIDPQYPVKNSLNVLSILVSSYFVCLRLQTRYDLVLFFKAVFAATLIYTFLLYIFVFDGVTMNFADSETFGKNTSSLIIFVGLISSLLTSLLSKRNRILDVVNIFFYITIFLTGSVKIIIVSSIILLFFFFFKEGIKIQRIIGATIGMILFLFLAERYVQSAGLEKEQSFLRITSRLTVLFGGESEVSYIDADYMTARRSYLIKQGLDIFYKDPVFGIGIENTRHYLGTYTHNNFVEILAGTGIVGFSVYMYTFFIILVACFKVPDNKIRLILLISFICIIMISNAQRVYDNRYLMIFLVSYISIFKIMSHEKK